MHVVTLFHACAQWAPAALIASTLGGSLVVLLAHLVEAVQGRAPRGRGAYR